MVTVLYCMSLSSAFITVILWATADETVFLPTQSAYRTPRFTMPFSLTGPTYYRLTLLNVVVLAAEGAFNLT